MALNSASVVASDRGDHDLHRSLLEDALPLAEATGGAVLSQTLCGLVLAHAETGEFEQARATAARCLAVASACGDQLEHGRALTAMATATFFAGEYDEAVDLTHDALTLAHTVSDLELEATTHGHLGVVHHLNASNEPTWTPQQSSSACSAGAARTTSSCAKR